MTAPLPRARKTIKRRLLRFARKRLRVNLRAPLKRSYPGRDPAVLGCCVAYNEHGAYCVPRSSRTRPAAQSILADLVWEPDTLALIRRRCRDGDIVHAGAYFGDFLPALSRICAPEAKVWAFEPNPENYRCASITVALNGLENVELRHAALGSSAGCAPLVVADEAGRGLGGGSAIARDSEALHAHDHVEVQVASIDECVPAGRKVSVIQLDVEGYEREALTGAIRSIRRWAPVLVLEHLNDLRWLQRRMPVPGYRRIGKVHSNWVFVPDTPPAAAG